ncbi:NAD(P)-dependent oxidoreductase [Mycobacterium lacus]|nr:NAD(P)-dependent oxidoreductase [Mycobacterium lacus]
MRILVTGATGYVGSCLVTALLADGHRVLAATRNPAGGIAVHGDRATGASRPGFRPGGVAGPPDAGVPPAAYEVLCPTRPAACSGSRRPSRRHWRTRRTARRGPSTPWPILITSPAPIRRGPAVMLCASGGSPEPSLHPSHGPPWGW